MRIKTILNKLAAWSISAFMVFNQCGLDAFATGTDDGSNTGSNPPQTVADRNKDADPMITIQHYLNFPQQDFTNVQITSDEGNWEQTNYIDPAKAKELDNYLKTKTVVWNTMKRSGQLPDNNTKNTIIDRTEDTGTLDKAVYKAMREQDPKWIFEMKPDSDGKYIPKTENVLYKMFKDETVQYLTKPQIRYMNKLYNTDKPNDFNPNYTLKEIWLSKDTNVIKLSR